MNLSAKQRLFTREYPALFDRMYRFVCYRIPCRPDAEDLVSEVFLEGFGKLDDFETTRGNLSQWLTGMAKNKIKMYWRSRGSVMTLLDEADDIILADEPRVDQLSDQLFAEKIVRALPQESKALLAMRYIDDMTHEEIAECVHRTPEAMRKWFSRLHEKLRIEFKD